MGRAAEGEAGVVTAVAILTDGLVYAAWLFVVAVGLALIFGVMKILNIAHGAFYAYGAYTAATALGVYFHAGLPVAGSYLAMVAPALLIGLLLGFFLERVLLRRLYGRDAVVIVLATFALFLILEDVLLLIWGAQGRSAYQPYIEAGNIIVGGLPVSNYDIGLVLAAAFLACVASYGLKRTRFGRLLATVIYDRETAAAFGINVARVFVVTFLLGAALGALGGALTAPKISVVPGIGVEVMVLAFAVVAIGGMGSIEGALAGALIVGIFRAAAVHLAPQLELFVIYAVMAMVLAIRPHGLFARAEPRKI
jgi:branched-chain amino acid transport system permease protein